MSEKLIIPVQGRINSDNAASFEKELFEKRKSAPEASVELDLSDLEYISSAGLRVLLKLQKGEKEKVRLTQVNKSVYSILDATGFNRIFEVAKAPREISIEGCELINKGGNGEAYRIDEDTILKLYNPSIPYSVVEDEQRKASNALIAGVPAAISFDTVKCRDRFGLLYEMIKSHTLAEVVMDAKEEEVSQWGVRLGRLTKELHSIKADKSEFPSYKSIFGGYIKRLGDLVPEGAIDRILNALNSVPEHDTLVHGDIHGGNVMLQGDEMLFIDLTDISYGHPIFDLYETYVVLHADPRHIPGVNLSQDRALCLWDNAIREYLGTDDAAKIAKAEQFIQVFSCIRLFASAATSARLPREFKEMMVQKAMEILPAFEKMAPAADAIFD